VAGGLAIGVMKKTSIYLDPEVDRALGHRATAEGTTKAALIRSAPCGRSRARKTSQATGVRSVCAKTSIAARA
jgi:predicted transcriptional regulator